MNNTERKIVITGYCAITAAGTGIAPLQDLLTRGASALTSVPFESADGQQLMWGHASHFKAADFMPPLKARKLDRSSQIATATAGLAIREAGIDVKHLNPERIGIAMGCGFGGIGNSAEFLTGFFNSGAEGMTPLLFPNTVSNASASNASIEHGLKGPNVTMVQRFCSAESALLMACRFIEQGRADIMLAGGIDELNPLMIKGFIDLGQHKSLASCFGEGCGIIVLESAESADRRGVPVRARLTEIRTVGLMPAGMEEEGRLRLTGDCHGISRAGFSGTADLMPSLTGLFAEDRRQSITPVVGRSLAMGATALATLIASTGPDEKAMHLAASPEGPYFSICFHGGTSA